MKKKTILSGIILCFTSLLLLAQNQTLSLNDVVRGGSNYDQINKKGLNHLKWKDDKHYSYVEDDSTLIIKTIKGKIAQKIELTDIKDHFEDYSPHSFPSHRWVNENTLAFKSNNASFYYNINTKNTRKLSFPEDAKNIDIAYPEMQMAYTIDHNLYLANEDNDSIAITHYKDPNIVCGQTVHRNEFGIRKGTFWSPNAKHLAYYIKDETAIHNYPLVDVTARAGEVNFIKYPMAGMPSEEVKVAIYNTDKQKSITLDTQGKADHYLSNIAWSPNSKQLYIAEINRGQDTMHLNCYDANTGAFCHTLFSESSRAYVEPQHAIQFIPNQDSLFLWQSRRDGYNHLYLYNNKGKLIKQISQGKWEITEVLGFDIKAQTVIVSTTEKSPLDRHVYALSLSNGDKTCYTQDAGYHRAKLSPNGAFLIDRWTALGKAETVDLIHLKNHKETELLQNLLPYQDFDLGQTELLQLKAADDSTDLFARLILPPHFDKTKKYPCIIYVYGGPHSQLINNSTYGNVQMWQHYMAQKGYVMFTVDNRGTSYRGAEFEQIIHRHLGKNEMADQMKAYDYLCQQNYIDTARIGVFGWSFGGFMTTSMMTHYPDAFKVGVAGGPVIDWSNYEVMYGERYMDTPQENPDGYEANNLCNHANKLKGRLLMIHGAQDPVVVWQHSQKFVRQCVEDGVQLDYFVYPTHQHNVRGSDRVHLMQKISQHFEDHL